MAVRPLKELLKEAEQFSKTLNKTASSSQAAPDEITTLADGLISAEEVEQSGESFEKTAMALNRAEALLQIRTLQKIAQFEEHAQQAGYSAEQINEVIEKISASKLKENLATLVAVEGAVVPGHDKNSLVKKKVPAKVWGLANE